MPVPPSKVDPYQNVVLHDTLFDWSDPTLDANSISRRIMGKVSHWDLPEFAGKKPWEIERKILFEQGRCNFGKNTKYGKPTYQHFLTLMKLMFPDTDITPALADATMLFCMNYTYGKKILNLIGSQNSGKSGAGCRIPFVCTYIDPEYSATYVANPFDNAADSTVWGDFEELWDQLCEHHPNTSGTGYADASSLFPWGKKFAARSIELIPNAPKAGRIELRNIKHVGKYKGTKTRGKNVDRGFFILVIDEVNEIENMSFLNVLSNISSQDAFSGITSQNYKDPEDMGGQLTEPVPLYGGPSSIDVLDIDGHMLWHSSRSSITLRFDGLRSPNILSGRTIYPKLFKAADEKRIREDFGAESPDYYSQVRSFPARSDATNSVLSRQKISASRHDDTFYSLLKVSGSAAFCDPAFGGRDKAVWGCVHWGPGIVTDGEGSQQHVELLVFKRHFEHIPLVKDAIYNDWWFDRMRKAGIDTAPFTTDAEVSYEDQIAIRCRELNRENGVPPHCFGYDFSMRPDIVSSMNRIIGFSTIPFDYNQDPQGVYLPGLKQNSEDCCKNLCSEMAFLAADVFLTKQVRGGEFITTAVTQLSRTRYETKNKKFVVEGKREYKARWQQVSPDHRDVLMGLVRMAVLRGFRQNDVSQPTKGASSVYSEIVASKIGRARTIKRFR